MYSQVTERDSIGRLLLAEPENIEDISSVVANCEAVLHGASLRRLPFRIPTDLHTVLAIASLSDRLDRNAADIRASVDNFSNDYPESRKMQLATCAARVAEEREEMTRQIAHEESKLRIPRRNLDSAVFSFRRYAGVVEHFVDDQVVVARGGTRLRDLQKDLAKKGQCLPLGFFALDGDDESTLAELIDMNMPHPLQAQCGSWRDWILGMTVVQADGSVAKCGSLAVKNVAGYDVQKLLIGARGTLGIVAEVILKTFPLNAWPEPDLRMGGEGRRPNWIQRVLPSDFDLALSGAGETLVAADLASHTLWCDVPVDQNLKRFDHDYVFRAGWGEKNIEIVDPVKRKLMVRTKDLFDPDHKLNPGEFGFI